MRKRIMVSKKCKECKEKFEVEASQAKRVYCSTACYNKGRSKGRLHVCVGCKKQFWVTPSVKKQRNPKYCTIECKKLHKPPVRAVCEYCGAEFEPPATHKGQKFCGRSCYEASRKRGVVNG